MAYSGQNTVIQFQGTGSLIAVTDSVIDASAASADYGNIIVPIPLMLYQFGLYCTESGAATLSGSVFLERTVIPAGITVTVVELDLDSTDLNSGDAASTAAITASTGSEDIDAGDVLYSPSSIFPHLITAPQVLNIRLVQTAVAGEYVPFVVGRWLGLDYRSTEIWAS